MKVRDKLKKEEQEWVCKMCNIITIKNIRETDRCKNCDSEFKRHILDD